MTPAEVAHLWNLQPRTVKARCKPGSRKRNRVEPCQLRPDLRWKRDQVMADFAAMSFHAEIQRLSLSGRPRRKA
jgi:hypothetical protein